jgi:hydroxyacylglutathione hydrolase
MEIVTIPCLYDNYSYLVIDTESGQAAVVDPSEAWPVMRELENRKLSLSAALCTHHHHDHIGGLDDLLAEYPGLRVLGFAGDKQRIPQLNELLADGDTFSVGSMSGDIFHTPGHTSASIVFHIGPALFVGDTLFGGGCGRLFEGSPTQMAESLARIEAHPPTTEIFFGHEYTSLNLRFAAQVDPSNQAIRDRAARVEELRREDKPSAPSTLAEELRTNPFLRASEPGIIEYLVAEQGVQDTSPLGVFTVLREMRNHFS